MFKWFINLVTGGLLDRLLSFGTTWLEKRNERIAIEREMFGDIVRHEIAAKMAARDVLLAEQGWWVTRWVRPLFAYPLIVYTWCIVADSVYFHSGAIQRLPDFLEEWYGWIVAAYFLTRPIEKAARGVSSSVTGWLRKRIGGGK